MATAHHHAEDRSAYYLDQLFTIGVCGAIAAVTLLLWQSSGPTRPGEGGVGQANLLAPKFFLWVALGGISLLTIVVFRAIAVWRSVDVSAEHEHGPECEHTHGGEHSHGGDLSLALAGAPAAVAHGHSHSHAHGDHEHGWAPWRYVVMLLPVVLYFLVLSNPALSKERVYLPSNPIDYIHNFIIDFSSIVWEALPFIVLGAVIAGLLEELLPQRVVASLLPRNRFLAVLLGGLLGLVFPMCECGIIPIMRRLLRKGLPLSCCVAYVLAGPIVNVVVILSTIAAFAGMENVFENGQPSYQMGAAWMTGFRVGLGYLTAVVASMFVEWQHRKHGDALLTPLARPSGLALVEEEKIERRSVWERVNNITETALHDFVDITVFLILGALLAATTRVFLTPDRIADLSREHVILAILMMMGLAIVLCLCSEADAFVAASFSTLRPSAKLAFLVLGPMLDFKLYFMYTRIFRPRLILTIYAAIVTQIFIYSLGVHYFWEKYAPSLITPVHAAAPPISEEEMKSLSVKAAQTVGLLAPAPGEAQQMNALVAWSMLLINPSEQIAEISFLQLENASLTPEMRHFYEGRRVRLIGRFTETRGGFTLIRFKINCCAADATPLKAAMFVEPPKALPVEEYRDKWVRVTGRVQFYQPSGSAAYLTALVITPTEREPLNKLIEIVPQDSNPYVY